MEGVPQQIAHMLFEVFMRLAMEVRTTCVSEGASPPLFFVAPQSVGAVPQVRSMCGLPPISPALAILDVDREVRYRFSGQLSPMAMKEFVEDFLQGRLTGEPWVDGSDSGGYAEAQRPPEAAPEDTT